MGSSVPSCKFAKFCCVTSLSGFYVNLEYMFGVTTGMHTYSTLIYDLNSMFWGFLLCQWIDLHGFVCEDMYMYNMYMGIHNTRMQYCVTYKTYIINRTPSNAWLYFECVSLQKKLINTSLGLWCPGSSPWTR